MKRFAYRVAVGLAIATQAIFGGAPASAQPSVPPQRKFPLFLMAAPSRPLLTPSHLP